MGTQTYSISTDFSNGVAPDRLSQEIRDSEITVALDYVGTDDDDCNCVFKADLSAGEITILDGLVAAHSGLPLPNPVAPVILEPTGDTAKSLQVVGIEFEANLNQETTHDVQFSETRDLQGVNTEVINHQAGPSGDTMRIAILAPDGQGGWVEVALLARGADSADGCVAPPSGIVGVVSEGTAQIPVGLKIQIKYNCVKIAGDKPLITMLFRTWV